MLTPTRRNILINFLTIVVVLVASSQCAKQHSTTSLTPLHLEWRVQPSYSWFQDYHYTLDLNQENRSHFQAVLVAGKKTRREQGQLNAAQTQALLHTIPQLPFERISAGSQDVLSTDQPTYSVVLTTPDGTFKDSCYGLPSSNRRAVHQGLERVHPGQVLELLEH